jgi:hypothetical protein
MTTSATDAQSINQRWFVGGRFEKIIRNHPVSYCGDLRIVTLKGRTRWTRKLMLAMMNVCAIEGGNYVDCMQPPHPEMISLRKYNVDILAGNCAVLTSKDGEIRFTLFPFHQSARMLDANFGMADQ